MGLGRGLAGVKRVGLCGERLLPLCGLPSPSIVWLTAGQSNLGFTVSSSLVGQVWKGDGLKGMGLRD